MEEINIKDLFVYYLKRIWIVLLFVVATFFLGVIYSKRNNYEYYTSNTKLMLSADYDVEVNQKNMPSNDVLVVTYLEMAKSRKVLNKVIDELDLKITYNELSNNVSTKFVEDSIVLEVKVKSKIKDNAKNIANSIASNLIEEVKLLDNKNEVIVLDEANEEMLEENIDVIKILIIFCGLGFVLGMGIILIIYFFDDTIRSVLDLEYKLKMPLLGYIKKNKNIIELDEDMSLLSINLDSRCEIDDSKFILLTSSKENEGKNYIGSRLASILAQTGKKVLIIDANLKTGKLHKEFNVENDIGFSNLIENEKEKIDKYIIKINDLDFIPSGVINNKNLINKNNVIKYFNKVKDVYDYIIIVGNHLSDSNTLLLSKLVDKVLLVGALNYTKYEDIKVSLKTLEKLNVNNDGIIINKI